MEKASRTFNLLLLASITLALISDGANASIAPQTENLESLGSSKGNSPESADLTAEAHTAERNEAGNLISVTWSIENSGNERVVLTWLKERSYKYDDQFFSGTTALGPDKETRFYPVMDGLGECLCSGKTSNDFRQRLQPDEKIAYWSLFSIPSDIETLNLEVPNFEPIEDIPIS